MESADRSTGQTPPAELVAGRYGTAQGKVQDGVPGIDDSDSIDFLVLHFPAPGVPAARAVTPL